MQFVVTCNQFEAHVAVLWHADSCLHPRIVKETSMTLVTLSLKLVSLLLLGRLPSCCPHWVVIAGPVLLVPFPLRVTEWPERKVMEAMR